MNVSEKMTTFKATSDEEKLEQVNKALKMINRHDAKKIHGMIAVVVTESDDKDPGLNLEAFVIGTPDTIKEAVTTIIHVAMRGMNELADENNNNDLASMPAAGNA